MTVSAWYNLFLTCCIYLFRRLVVYFGILDHAFAAVLVFCVGSLMAALVCDLVLHAGAVSGTLSSVDTIFHLHLTAFLG